MSEPRHPGFEASIIEEPDNNDLRLIYADWLADNGDPDRAEFIRLQISGRLSEAWDVMRRSATWEWKMPHPLYFSQAYSSWQDGFIARPLVTLWEWIDNHEDIITRHPLRGLALVQGLPIREVRRLHIQASDLSTTTTRHFCYNPDSRVPKDLAEMLGMHFETERAVLFKNWREECFRWAKKKVKSARQLQPS